MKNTLLFIAVIVFAQVSQAQISITASDMPVVGDTLRYSITAGLTSGINVADSGANKTWVYDTLRPIAQGRDDYKAALTVSPLYGIISLTAYGYKIADSVPGLSGAVPGLSISEIYTFFNKKSGPSRYIAEGFGAKISGTPIPSVYSDEDEIYYFPLTYPHATDSSTFAVTISVPFGPITGKFKRAGYRKTTVDGWGTIKTPYYTTAASCIRVRSEIHEIDSVVAPSPLSVSLAIPMDTIQYDWLVNGSHYPALSVTQSRHTGILTMVTYKDSARHHVLNVNKQPLQWQELDAYPNPGKDRIQISVPADWRNYNLYIYDAMGRIVLAYKNITIINLESLSSGKYTCIVKNGNEIGYVQIVKQ